MGLETPLWWVSHEVHWRYAR